jgi:hypothetical protein
MAGIQEIITCQSLLKVLYSYWLFGMDRMFNVENHKYAVAG